MINFVKINTVKEFEELESYYYCDSFGNIYSNVWGEMKLLKSQTSKHGYERITLRLKNGKHKTYMVHRIICYAFNSNTENKPEVNHINHVRNDNRCENLEFVTREENCDEIWYKNVKQTNRNNNCKKRKQVITIDENGKVMLFNSVKECAMFVKTSSSQVSQAIRHGYKCHGYEVNYVWEY